MLMKKLILYKGENSKSIIMHFKEEMTNGYRL